MSTKIHTKIDWQALFFEQNWLDRIDRLAQIRFGDSATATEAANYAFNQMSADNWNKLNQFKGESKPETYLRVIAGNYLEEFSRKKFGRARPPKWLEDRGPLWVAVWKMVCIERQLQETVVDRMTAKFQRDKDLIVGAIQTIRGKLPWCGHQHQEIPEVMFASDESANTILESQEDSEYEIDKNTTAAMVDSLFLISALLNQKADLALLQDINESHQKHLAGIIDRMQAFGEAISSTDPKQGLTDVERIVLKMHFQDGYKKKDIAEALNIASYQPGREIKSAMKKIFSALKDAGLDMKEIEALVQEYLT